MVQPIFRKKEKDLGNQEADGQLSTEEEVKMLKQELARKEKELETLKDKPEGKPATILKEKPKEKKEKIKEEKEKIRISPEEPGKAKLPKKATKPAKVKDDDDDDDMDSDLKQIMSMDKPKQVKTLVYLAFKKGVNYATSIASQLRDPYLLDEFHDTLVDNLYDLLKKKKKI